MNKPKKIIDEKTPVFAESEVLVVLERMEDNFKLMAEGQAGLTERMGRMENEMKEGFEKVDRKIDFKIDELRNEMKEGFSLAMDYLKRIDEEVAGIRKDIEKLKKEKVDWEAYRPLEKRLEEAEKKIRKLEISLENKKVAA